MSLFGCKNISKEDQFWIWLKNNSQRIAESNRTDDATMERLSEELKKVDANLVYEITGQKRSNLIEFAISADGNPKLIPTVEKLYAKRPSIENWDIKAFRQRNSIIFDFEMNDVKILGKETKYVLLKDDDPDKLDILLFFPNFDEARRKEYGGAAYIFMDGIIGEYDVMKKVGFIDVFGFDSKYIKDAKPINELVMQFDNYFCSRK